MSKKKPQGQFQILNKKAKFNYELLNFLETGIVLLGSEVKSLRDKKGNLTDAFARIRNNEVFLEGFHIPPYKNGGYANHSEFRPRKLLLKKKEIVKLERKVKERGFSLIATKCYFKDQLFKVEIALAKSKKLHDKRETLKKKDMKEMIDRNLKIKNR